MAATLKTYLEYNLDDHIGKRNHCQKNRQEGMKAFRLGGLKIPETVFHLGFLYYGIDMCCFEKKYYKIIGLQFADEI